jgi:4-amino-4-deoxy-L-arabinose transferase-like glycosyltransferase
MQPMIEKFGVIPRGFFSADEKRLTPLAYFFLLMLCVAFFTPGLVTMPPTDRDESLFAQASKQMVESGNYTNIRIQDAPRYKKPIGIYWLQSTAVRLFNPHHLDQIWAYRLPSLTGATIAVLMTAALGALLFTPAVGLLGAMMMAGCVLLNVEARLATTDAALLACIMVAMYGLARAYLGQVVSWHVPLAFWTAFAFGVLLKGPIILLPVAGTLLWLQIADKNIGWFRTLRPLIGILYALMLILPWFIIISLHSHGAFFQQSAGNDMLAKIWHGQNRGFMPPGLHLMALPLLFFPFALFVALGTPDVWRNRKEGAVKFCLGWIVPTWLVFEISLTKLPHYVLPTYPALALLAAKFLLDGFPSATHTPRRLSIALVIAFWLMVGISFAAVFSLLPLFVEHRWMWTQVAFGLTLIFSQALALLLLPQSKSACVNVLVIGSLLFMTSVFGNTLPGLRHLWFSNEIVETVSGATSCQQNQIVSVGYHQPSLVFLAGTDTLLPATGGEAGEELKQDPCRIAVVDNRHKQDFLDVFKDAPQQAIEAGTIDGIDTGHGAQPWLTLYRMLPAPQMPDNAP